MEIGFSYILRKRNYKYENHNHVSFSSWTMRRELKEERKKKREKYGKILQYAHLLGLEWKLIFHIFLNGMEEKRML